MPREKKARQDLFQTWFDSDPEFYADLQVCEYELFCNVCQKLINSSSKTKVTRHLKSHASSSIANHGFSYDLTIAFIASGISLEKLNKPALRDLLKKYTNRNIPHPSTLRKGYVDLVYNDVVKAILEDISDNFVYFMVDEATDACGRSVTNLLIGALRSGRASSTHLLASNVIDNTDHEKVVNFIDECFNYVWPGRDDTSKVLVMLSDATTHMLKAASILSTKYSNMLHFTCVACALKSVADKIKDCFPSVDNLMSKVEKIFTKAPTRTNVFKEMLPNIPLPPEQNATRWSSWLEAVAYYDEYFECVESVICRLDSREINDIKKAQDLLRQRSVRDDFRYIINNYGILIDVMRRFEIQGLSLSEQFTMLEDVVRSINDVSPNSVSLAIKEDMLRAFQANPGYSTLESICQFQNGTIGKLPPDVLKYSTCIDNFSHCPISIVEGKKSYSMHKLILNSRRQALTPKNLEKLMVIHSEYRASN